jgi:Tfp pilus assembly protein PilO
MKMNSKKLFFTLIAALVLVNSGGIALLVFGNKYLDKQNGKLTDLKVQSSTLDTVQQSLIKAKKDIATYSDLANIVSTVVPQEKDQARTVRELVKIANDNGIQISHISFPTSSLGTGPTTGAPTANQGTAGSISQTQKVDGISNVERLEITVQSDNTVPYHNFISFLQGLENNRRTAQVSGINITPDKNGVKFTLTLNVYIKKAS